MSQTWAGTGPGAVEAVFSILSLVDHVAPPTRNLTCPDAGNPLGPALVGQQARPLPLGPKAILTNSFGFGGTNACLLFATPPLVVDELVDGDL